MLTVCANNKERDLDEGGFLRVVLVEGEAPKGSAAQRDSPTGKRHYRFQAVNLGPLEDVQLHSPSRPTEDPKDIIIRTLRAEIAELAEVMERHARIENGPEIALRVAAARALLARLEPQP